MLPSLTQLELVKKKIKDIPNRQGEYKRKIHYCCYLLCHKSGLRISEAIKFDLNTKTRKGLYRIEKPKGKKERWVYVPKKVINELKENDWKPNQTNRFTFYWFLQKIKREIGISKNTELTPHTLRRSFTTYYAEAGMPLPLLQKWLGHNSVRTTSLYWRNIYEKPFSGKIPINGDINDILAAKKWLENKEPPKSPITENFPKQLPKKPKPIFIANKPVIPVQKLTIKSNSPLPSQIKEPEPLKIREILIQPIKQREISKPLSPITSKSEKEQILLTKTRQLEEQLKQTQTECDNLRIEKDKEKTRADQLEVKLKTISQLLHQWQKLNFYQQLEKQRAEMEAKIIQPPPFKVK